jgi:chromosome segregation ATPase
MQEEIAQARSQIEDLEEQKRDIRDTNESLQADLSKLTTEHEQQAQEIATLRSRASISQQNWLKERDELISREAYAREEFETAKQAMQDWEVLAMEERSLRENLSEKVAEMEEQFNSQKEALERAASERDNNSDTINGLQRALQEIQEGILNMAG